MRKFTMYNLQCTIFALCLSFYILHFTFYIPTAFAVDSTPSATVKSKLEKFKKEIASKAAALKQEVNKKLQNKAYVGAIKSASGSAILIIDKSGIKNIKVNQDTIFENQVSKKKTLKFTDLKESQLISGLGEIDELNNLIAKKVILLADSNWQETYKAKTVLWGKVISQKSDILTVKDRDGRNNAVSTKAIDTIIKTNEFVIFTGYLNKNSILDAAFGYVITQGGTLKPKNLISTPSAQIATPSAKPKPTPTPKTVKK